MTRRTLTLHRNGSTQSARYKVDDRGFISDLPGGGAYDASRAPTVPNHLRTAWSPKGYRLESWWFGKLMATGPYRRTREAAWGDQDRVDRQGAKARDVLHPEHAESFRENPRSLRRNSSAIYAPGGLSMSRSNPDLPTTGKVSWKQYKCTQPDCGHEYSTSTNHYGDIYSKCPKCYWKGTSRVHRSVCLEPVPVGMGVPAAWTSAKSAPRTDRRNPHDGEPGWYPYRPVPKEHQGGNMPVKEVWSLAWHPRTSSALLVHKTHGPKSWETTVHESLMVDMPKGEYTRLTRHIDGNRRDYMDQIKKVYTLIKSAGYPMYARDEDTGDRGPRVNGGPTRTSRKVRSNPVRLTAKDKKAILAFLDRKPAKGTHIDSEFAGGVYSEKGLSRPAETLWPARLRLNGPFLREVAYWTDDGIVLQDMGSKSGETIHRFIRAHAPKNDLVESKARSNPRGGGSSYVLARKAGLDTRVVSAHKTRDAAIEAMKKKTGGYGPDSAFGGSYLVLDVGPSGGWEVITIFGKKELRPKTRWNASKAHSNPRGGGYASEEANGAIGRDMERVRAYVPQGYMGEVKTILAVLHGNDMSLAADSFVKGIKAGNVSYPVFYVDSRVPVKQVTTAWTGKVGQREFNTALKSLQEGLRSHKNPGWIHNRSNPRSTRSNPKWSPMGAIHGFLSGYLVERDYADGRGKPPSGDYVTNSKKDAIDFARRTLAEYASTGTPLRVKVLRKGDRKQVWPVAANSNPRGLRKNGPFMGSPRRVSKVPKGYVRIYSADSFTSGVEAERAAAKFQQETFRPATLVYVSAAKRKTDNPWAVYAPA